ncbi:hypothetical protein N825_04865 [Skermanella stibiiresistens SB22]|jgi:hypothetical protein|uniref:Uncharacterized protein n=1 Tax=Skermanella stibiiresistens SB22 TaxID=1385369 RepID=W9H551_9PROT|nr:hypothetical protein N825_04865 [Skermanella stibiiresistens SB22]
MTDIGEMVRDLSLYSAGMGLLCLAFLLVVQAF